MLIDFKVSNYRSFKTSALLDLRRVNKLKEPLLDGTALIKTGRKDLELLRAAIIYGENGSGKSNLLKAFGFMKYFIRNSHSDSLSGDPIPAVPFKFDENTVNAPSYFQVSLLLDGSIYRYGFSVTRDSVDEEVLAKDNKVLFHRKQGKLDSHAEKIFVEGKERFGFTRDNSLFLSVCARDNGRISSAIANFFSDDNFIVLTGVCDRCYRRGDFRFLGNSDKKDKALRFMEELGLNISDISYTAKTPSFVERDDELRKRTTRDRTYETIQTHYQVGGDAYQLDLNAESEGTQKLLTLAGIVIDALDEGKVLVVDEFDARVHPTLVSYLMQLFCSHYNKKGAQLIVAVHDTHLLKQDFIRRDQFWFAERCPDSMGSQLKSLAEFKVRKDISYEKDYLGGRYGAIPEVPAISRRENEAIYQED
ncbi:MAG: ATP-binding protein [Planctomycetaceae bacterium]|nr:ATP-binding protein [Planctomycetaceae bacterium]